ncbi:MAG: hypothetical protein JWN52_87 [Actinomycetia bacterium]|nr:hypothetical protein [Actinomycetes bacterium]
MAARGSKVLILTVAVSCTAAGLAACGGGGGERDRTKKAAEIVNRPIHPQPTASPVDVPPLQLNPKGKASAKAEAAGAEGARSAWPSLRTSGIPQGKKLKRSGPITVHKDGTVIDGLEVQTEINIEANNVTVRNSHVIGAGEWSIIQRKGFSGLRVENTEINGDGKHQAQFGILNFGGMLTVRRSYIHTVSDGIGTDQGLIEDSVILGPKEFPKDHIAAIASNDGPAPGMTLVIRHNVLFNPLGQTSAVSIYQDFGRAHDVTLDNNLMAGGGYTLYAGKGKYGQSTNIKITRNAFSNRYFKNSGAFGPVVSFEPGPGNVWSGNVWAESGKPVMP